MKLAIIRRRYNPYGGAERFIERLIPKLSERGIDTCIVAEQWQTESMAAKVITAPVSGVSRRARFQSFQKAVAGVIHRQSKAGDGFDLVQSHERIPGVNVFRLGDGVHTAWLNRLKKNVGGLRAFWLGIDPFHKAVIAAERAMASDPNLHFVANSGLVAKEVKHYLEVPEERITIIPNGVDTQHFYPATDSQRQAAQEKLALAHGLKIEPQAMVIAVVGSGFERKGIFHLIQACAKLQDTVLLICGKDKESKKADALIKALGAENRIVLTGPLQDVRPVLWAADIFALPSLYDPSSNAVLEALSCGLPVVVTQDVGMAWEITDADAGLICEQSMASLLQSLRKCQERERRRKMAYQARAFALRYDQDGIIDQWIHFYQTQRTRKRC
jgi:UDP-glucose:(heptosyl)LPS alpha-1,3-glucosyltransferase